MVDTQIAGARSRYLDGHVGPLPVRPLVLASWERSAGHHLCPDHLEVPYLDGYDSDTPLCRAAAPVLDALHEQLANEPVSTMLTDASGVILVRRVSHDALSARLDLADLSPGHVFTEEFVGTNGIGTALAGGAPVTIDGPEHFVEALGGFSCAAVPILHPTRRTVVGAFNLTIGLDLGSGPIALALATSTARQIEREFALVVSHREHLLFERYLDACRAFRRMPVLAFNSDVVMMNDRLRAAITGADQTALLDHAREQAGVGRALSLPSGAGRRAAAGYLRRPRPRDRRSAGRPRQARCAAAGCPTRSGAGRVRPGVDQGGRRRRRHLRRPVLDLPAR